MSGGAKRPDHANHGGNYSYAIKSVLFGVAAGDALGVPVEFKSREYMNLHPVTGMTGFGTHSQPPGTWSDDSSMTFCLAEALTQKFDLNIFSTHYIYIFVEKNYGRWWWFYL